MNIEKRLDPWMNLCHLYLAAVLKREVDEAREAKEQKRQESARLAQELRCVEERNRWKSVCLSRFRSARPDLELAFQFPHLTAMRVRIIFVRQFLFNILFNSSLYD